MNCADIKVSYDAAGNSMDCDEDDIGGLIFAIDDGVSMN